MLIRCRTNLWYWACRNWNSSFIRSKDSGIVNLNGCPGAWCGVCKRRRLFLKSESTSLAYSKKRVFLNKPWNADVTSGTRFSPPRPRKARSDIMIINNSHKSIGQTVVQLFWDVASDNSACGGAPQHDWPCYFRSSNKKQRGCLK